ncbi:MAG: HPr kinase/phosphatase C-terminal domain-containing protein [Rhodobacteraceae bacterium]|nr:HPr kinase/phosphatase C-terminal domain-containing protein [Paracoccaceae bacterium]
MSSDTAWDGPPGTKVVHASAVRIGEVAVLVTGPSGSGKSTLCLELMAFGARLIADDRTRLLPMEEAVWAEAPPTLPHAIEARGVGLIPVRLAPRAPVRLVVDMGATETERLPPPRNTSLCGHNVTLLRRSETTHFASAVLLFVAGVWSE